MPFAINVRNFRHIDKPEFQDMIYNYPGKINIRFHLFVVNGMSFTLCMANSNEAGENQF